MLLVAALIALLWANSPWAAAYTALWQTELSLGFGDVRLTETLLHWINDGLMAIFFLMVSLLCNSLQRRHGIGRMASRQRCP
jgi:Na+:H+ antiporter, NhaA family